MKSASKRKRKRKSDDSDTDYNDSDFEDVAHQLARLRTRNTTTVDEIVSMPDIDQEDLPTTVIEEKSKKRRPDVTARRVANAGTTVSVVKTTLNSFCKEEGKALPWESVLQDMNKAVLEAYVLANIHVVRLCQANLPIEPLNNTFFYRCLTSVASGEQKSQGCEQLKLSVKRVQRVAWRGRQSSEQQVHLEWLATERKQADGDQHGQRCQPQLLPTFPQAPQAAVRL